MQQQITEALKTAQRFVQTNSPAILTGVAVAGSVSTAVLSGRAHAKAVLLTTSYEDAHTELLPAREKLAMTWKLYIPPVATGIVTVGCIIGANTVSSRRQAALLSAYSVTERAFSDYKEKVVEILGEKKDEKIRDSVAQDRIDADPMSSNEVVIIGGGEVLCYETVTGRYFTSTHEKIRRAENECNALINTDMYVAMNEFNKHVGLPITGYGEEIGWNTDKRLDIQISAVVGENNKPCLSVGYKHLPFPGFQHF